MNMGIQTFNVGALNASMPSYRISERETNMSVNEFSFVEFAVRLGACWGGA
jgi:hypothetical protein